MFSEIGKNWWLFLVRGLVAIIFGVLAFIQPAQIWLALVALFGAFVLVDGIFTTITGIMIHEYFDRWWAILLEGVLGIAIGLLTLILLGPASQALIYIIAAWAIVKGIFEILAAITIRLFILREWSMILSGIVSIFLGILLFVFPGSGLIGLMWAIGLYAMVFGAMLIVLAARLRSLRSELKSSGLSSSL